MPYNNVHKFCIVIADQLLQVSKLLNNIIDRGFNMIQRFGTFLIWFVVHQFIKIFFELLKVNFSIWALPKLVDDFFDFFHLFLIQSILHFFHLLAVPELRSTFMLRLVNRNIMI
jgi:hypothetical protein